MNSSHLVRQKESCLFRYYEIFPQEKVEEIEEYEEFMANGDFYKRNQMLLTKVLQELP